MIKQFVEGKFDDTYEATVGADFTEKELVANDSSVTLQIWDTAGQERLKSKSTAFYRGAGMIRTL